jgi:hypothetical protein
MIIQQEHADRAASRPSGWLRDSRLLRGGRAFRRPGSVVHSWLAPLLASAVIRAGVAGEQDRRSRRTTPT